MSLDLKISYFIISDGEAKEIALRGLYSNNLSPEIPWPAMKTLLRLAVTNVQLKLKGIWCFQSDGLAMGASLAVILEKCG